MSRIKERVKENIFEFFGEFGTIYNFLNVSPYWVDLNVEKE